MTVENQNTNQNQKPHKPLNNPDLVICAIIQYILKTRWT